MGDDTFTYSHFPADFVPAGAFEPLWPVPWRRELRRADEDPDLL